jgi:hypothetical protein
MAKPKPAKPRKRFGEAFGTAALAELNKAAEISKVLKGHYHPKRHSDGETPWQLALGGYEVRFSEKTPRGTPRRDGGSWGIYLRDWNVRVATFTADSAALRKALAQMFDAAHALSESWKAVAKNIKGNHDR